ncbi:MAG: hypothetical protein QOG41_2256 [Thermoleophilaceae bacterium]|jgi:hypothetical protein|nr:hypothetical protein [Thermoleophilaceae bacterium]
MFSHKRARFVAAGAAAAAIAIGGLAVGISSSGNGASGTANATPAAQTAPGPGPRTTPAPGAANGPVPTAVYGQVPKGWHPGSGTRVTGAAANKAKAAALARYPGTVNRVLKLSDGSYAVHMFATSGPHHVFVSKGFKVTGAA